MSSYYQIRAEAHAVNLFLSVDGAKYRFCSRPCDSFEDAANSEVATLWSAAKAEAWISGYAKGCSARIDADQRLGGESEDVDKKGIAAKRAEITHRFMARTNANDDLRKAEQRHAASVNQPGCFQQSAAAELKAARRNYALAEFKYVLAQNVGATECQRVSALADRQLAP